MAMYCRPHANTYTDLNCSPNFCNRGRREIGVTRSIRAHRPSANTTPMD